MAYITSTQYTVHVLRYSYGNPQVIGYVTDVADLAIARTVNGYDTLQFTVRYGTEGTELLQPDTLIRVYRQNNLLGVPSSMEFQGLVTKMVVEEAEVTTLTVTAFGLEHILARRIIAWREGQRGRTLFPVSPTAGFEYPSTILAYLVESNIGSLATSTRELATNLIGTGRFINGQTNILLYDAPTATLENMPKFGRTISSVDGIARQNLLETMQEIADEGEIAFWMDYAVVEAIDPSNFILCVFMADKRRGADRSQAIKLSIGTGTIASVTTTYDYTQIWTVAMMNGGGQGASERRFVYPPYPRAQRDIAQRETYLTSATGTPKGNRATAIAEYKKMQRSIREITCEVQQSQGTMYGRDYFLGDLISVETLGGVVQMQVRSVTLAISSDGREAIGVNLEFE